MKLLRKGVENRLDCLGHWTKWTKSLGNSTPTKLSPTRYPCVINGLRNVKFHSEDCAKGKNDSKSEQQESHNKLSNNKEFKWHDVHCKIQVARGLFSSLSRLNTPWNSNLVWSSNLFISRMIANQTGHTNSIIYCSSVWWPLVMRNNVANTLIVYSQTCFL